MKSSATDASAAADPEGAALEGLSLRFALGMAAALGGLVLLLNVLEPPPEAVSLEVFTGLVDKGQIKRILHGPDGLEAYADGPIRWQQDGRYVQATRLWVQTEAGATAAAIAGWRQQGIEVAPLVADSGLGGMLVLVLGLGGGLGYLVYQVRLYRREGSPRQRLKDLEEALENGQIDAEQYQKATQAQWARM